MLSAFLWGKPGFCWCCKNSVKARCPVKV